MIYTKMTGMKQLRWIPLLIMGIVMVMNYSCREYDLYDEKKTQEINDSVMPIDSVDLHHNWMLYNSAAVTVIANDNVGAQWAKVLTADPRVSTEAEVAAQVPISDGGTANLSFSYPKRLDSLYLAMVDDEGLYTVTRFKPDIEQTVYFTRPLYRKQLISYTPQPQMFVFCFEEEMPYIIDADNDYNDIVLNLSYERTADREICFHVQLAAVGIDKQVAAAIRLKNYKYTDIESITTVGNASFNKNPQGEEVPNQILTVHKNKELLLESLKNREAVINLFCDGHWATGVLRSSDEDYGRMVRKRYNVTTGSSENAQTMVPREVTYVVTFKKGVSIDNLNFELLDPFIIKMYLGGIYEVHPFAYRHDNVLNVFKYDELIRIPWSLTIPYSKFRHPLEGVNIGFKKKDIMGFGAYGLRGHSFGEWSMDQNKSIDWYLNEYATENQVY